MANQFTLLQIRQMVQDLSHRTELANTSTELNLINLSLQILQDFGYFRCQLETKQITSPAVTSGDSGRLTIVLPASFRDFEDIVQLSPTLKSNFARPSLQVANIEYNTNQTLTDSLFEAVATDKDNLYFYPRFLATQNFAAGYWIFELSQRISLDVLSQPSDHNYFTDNAHHILVFMTLAFELVYTTDMDDAMSILNYAQSLAEKWALKEYGESWSGTKLTIGELEKMLQREKLK